MTLANQTKSRKAMETARKLKVLFLDVEVSANLGWVWNKYEQDVLEFESEKQIISFAWQWLGEKKVHVLALPDFPGYKRDPNNNKALVTAIHKLINEADVTIGHNIDAYDEKVMNTDFALNDLGPVGAHKTVDTLKILRTKFKLNSNKLGDACKRFKLRSKAETGGFKLWLGCMRGDIKSWVKMKKYNAADIVALRELYFFVRPWATNHPNMLALENRPGCPHCRAASTKMVITKWRTAYGKKSPQFQCRDCRHYSSGAIVNGQWSFK